MSKNRLSVNEQVKIRFVVELVVLFIALYAATLLFDFKFEFSHLIVTGSGFISGLSLSRGIVRILRNE